MDILDPATGKIRLNGANRSSTAPIIVDFTPPDSAGIAMDVAPTPHSTSERAGAKLGDFFIGQDPSQNGTHDFGIVDAAGNVILRLTAGAAGTGGVAVSTLSSIFGAGSAVVAGEGNIYRQISAAGIQPGATGVDSVLAAFSLPANSFDVAGRGIAITAQGSFGAAANNKRVKIIVNPSTAVVGSTVGTGGVTVGDTGTITTSSSGWSVQANVFKYGANGSNTQLGLHSQAQMGAAVGALLAPSLITAVESGAILIAVTGNATTAVGDIIFNFLEINAMN
ncbi:MAG: hypothetical protein ACXWHZ_03680 [Usitatibacter sp.]